MNARERATLAYWRSSKAALRGDEVSRRRLELTASLYKRDVERIANAASNTLIAADQRATHDDEAAYLFSTSSPDVFLAVLTALNKAGGVD